MLHILNRSPYDSKSLKSCINIIAPNDVMLLIEDAVYAAIKDSEASEIIKTILDKNKVFVVEPDVKTRGCASKIISGISLISYEGFVDLVVDHYPVQSYL